jgi:LmbE family N-acetylglucosaminyl deacetylase
MVFAPHPDDETLGCGGTIALKVAQGAEVSVVFMTDGADSHRQFVSRSELAQLRRREAVAACSVLGVAERAVRFMDFPDGELHRHRDAAVARVGALLAGSRAEQLFVPYFAEAPADHWVTRQVVLDGLRRAGRRALVYEYPIWFWNHWPWARERMDSEGRGIWRPVAYTVGSWLRLLRDFRCWVDVDDVLEIKRAALAEHRSQMVRVPKHEQWPVLADVAGGDFLACFFVGREWFYQHPG